VHEKNAVEPAISTANIFVFILFNYICDLHDNTGAFKSTC
jgi:hypothetical protein